MAGATGADPGNAAMKNAPAGAFFMGETTAYFAITRTISSTLFE